MPPRLTSFVPRLMIKAMDQHVETSTEQNLSRRGVSLAPWMIWSIAALHILLWIIVALGYSWPAISGGGNAGIPDFIEHPIQNPTSHDDIDKRMLAAQEAMAGFASWMYLLGIGTLATTAAGTIALLSQIRATNRAVNLTARANDFSEARMQLEMRPWVTARPFAFKLVPNEIPVVDIITRNSGNTPAIEVYQSKSLFIGYPPIPAPGEDQGFPGIIGAGDQLVENFFWDRPIRESEVIQILSGTWVVRLYVHTSYKSVFNAKKVLESRTSFEWDRSRATFVPSAASETILT